MLALHIGPGRLGLGLIVEQLLAARIPVCLIGPARAQEPEGLTYSIAYTDPDIGLLPQTVQWASNASSFEELPAEVRSLIESDSSLLITCALGEAIAERESWIIDVVRRRPADAETVLLACENEPDSAYGRIQQACGERLQTPPCVVDRICAWPPEGRYDSQGHRRVVAHPTGEWVISTRTPLPESLKQLAKAPLVHVTHDSIDGFKARKLWLVNGIHMVLALVARQEDVHVLPLRDNYASLFVELAEPLMRVMALAVKATWPSVDTDDDYVHRRIYAFLENPDTTRRIFKETLVRADLRPFMNRLDGRLGEAARAAHAARLDTSPFEDVMALVVGVLADLKNYYDSSEPAAPDPAVDEQAIEQFAHVLCDWHEPRSAEQRVAALKRALRGHYGLFKPLRQ